MNVILSPVAPRCTVADADDPYKKFWFAILAGFAGTGIWLLTPMLGEPSIGSTVVGRAPKNDAGVEPALTAADTGAPAGTAEEAAARKKIDESSRLYQAPPEAPATAETAAASGSTLADELKKVSRGEGGWSEKAHRGFTSPKLSGGAISGLSSAAGGRAGSASTSSGTSAFGVRNSQVGYAAPKNVPVGGTAAASKGVAALQGAAASAKLAAGTINSDAASGSLNKIFDGAKSQGQIGGPGGGAVAGLTEKLDSAPVNLKLDDPKLDEKKKKAPPAAAPAPPSGRMDDAQLGRQMAMTMAGAFLGGLLPGAGGAMVTSVVMQTLQRQEAQMQKISDMQQKHYLDAQARQMGAMPRTQ
jgi:hypothetical protein